MDQETEPGQEVTVETDALPCSQKTSSSTHPCNHSNKQKCSTCYEATAVGSTGGGVVGAHQCWPHKEQNIRLESPPSPQIQPSPRPAVPRYRRHGDSEAKFKRHRQRQQREMERTHSAQQGKQHHGETGQEDDSMRACSASTEKDLKNQQLELEDKVDSYEPQQAEAKGSNYPPELFSLLREPLAEATYGYAQPPGYSAESGDVSVGQNLYSGLEVYSELYENSSSERVYEEIYTSLASIESSAGGANDKESFHSRNASIQQLQHQPGDGGYRQRGVVGSRLHHYADCSDGESDSPEKEAEFALYPHTDTCDHDEDTDSLVAEVKHRLSPQSQRYGSKDVDQEKELPVEEKTPQSETQTSENDYLEAGSQRKTARHQATTSLQEPDPGRDEQTQKDAISLAIKDIKEAIQEVKTRTVKSPYTPDEPKEPVWVMRQDFSPGEECNLQPSLGDTYPCPDSPSPPGAESSSRHLLQDDTYEVSSSCKESRRSLASFPTYVEVPGPCDAEDLINGIIFAAVYWGSTQLLSEKTPSKNVRMMQAQEAVKRIKVVEGEAQPMTEVDLFISTQRIKMLNADSQDTMMDHPLQTISYIADIGNIVVLMARRRLPQRDSQENVEASEQSQDTKRQYKMICHVFESEDATLIAQSIGQAFSVAYQEFLRANGINPEDLSQKEYSDLLSTQDLYNDDLVHFSKSDNCKDVFVEKAKGEILGVVVVESGWGSILPTVVLANMLHAGPAERSGRLNIGDQIMSINGTSLVGLPLSTCQSIIRGLKNQCRIKLNIVRCPPVTTVLIRRPDLRYQLGFSVQNGIICSLMRGGIAERGGVRVGHRIIEINAQSVVATPHEKIVHILSNAVGEINMKTMPATMYRLLTAQEQPLYI
ncbi:amyloid-beta A4 precursor protein-binding family A member 1 [Cololabis saira]|uniref:amyloid-beta A4 precursor protein-binding family A member 1 n=1 Tax=Cololabis saira TaxID=129043 RepID=UPI002AD2A1C3|nr:amyloid-beta A4 precursor protein-binding family A member 1 [Cololabis saira]